MGKLMGPCVLPDHCVTLYFKILGQESTLEASKHTYVLLRGSRPSYLVEREKRRTLKPMLQNSLGSLTYAVSKCFLPAINSTVIRYAAHFRSYPYTVLQDGQFVAILDI